MIRWLKQLFKTAPNPHCECEKNCGAGIEYYGNSVKKNWCPTVMERLIKPYRKYPFNQIGVDGQSLEINESTGEWKLIKERS